MSTSTSWQRHQGQITAPDARVLRTAGFLDGALVVAILEADPEEQAAVWVSVATDPEQRVAVLGPDAETVIPGPPLQELAEALAQECQGTAIFGDVIAVNQPEGETEDPFEPHLDVTSVPERTVVLLHGGRESAERLATSLGATVHAVLGEVPELGEDSDRSEGAGSADTPETPETADRESIDRHAIAVLLVDAPGVEELDFTGQAWPAVVLERRTMYPAVTAVNGAAHTHVWGLERAIIPGGGVAPAFAEQVLGHEALADGVLAALPDADRDRVLHALRGPELAPLVGALGLPQDLVEPLTAFLDGETDATDVPGAQELEPVGLSELVRRRARLAADDARNAALQAREDARERTQHATEDAWRRAQQAAEDARTGVAAFADAAEQPARTWGPYALAAVETVAGAVLWRRSSRPGTKRGWAVTGKVAAAVLFSGALANVGAAVWPRLRGEG
ncbi:hypothetical protein [Ruania halotolerans]|uniref:hypothetical protein n=1 Tax=Ruania halotolerans TaxID=2897773 RepID=UPI001E53B050|nr:hypothetical protein [Ruania halotolerans]UFU07195.1 hypothetical protein LQF10_03540 [Ruania halotolerans]